MLVRSAIPLLPEKAPEKELAALEEALTQAHASLSNPDQVWAEWLPKFNPWTRRAQDKTTHPSRGWELLALFADKADASSLRALLACPGAPSGQALESRFFTPHALLENHERPDWLVGWDEHLSVLGKVVSTSGWSRPKGDEPAHVRAILEMVDVLREHGVRLNAPVTTSGRHALGLANQAALVEGLLERGADPMAQASNGRLAMAQFWDGPCFVNSHRAAEMAGFWKQQKQLGWTVERWEAWCDAVVERLVYTMADKSPFGRNVLQQGHTILSSLFQMTMGEGAAYRQAACRKGAAIARKLVLSSLSPSGVPHGLIHTNLAPEKWWPQGMDPGDGRDWLLIAQALAVSLNGDLSASLSRRTQDTLIGEAARRQAKDTLPQTLLELLEAPNGLVKAWTVAASLAPGMNPERFLGQVWPLVAERTLEAAMALPEQAAKASMNHWFDSAHKGRRSSVAKVLLGETSRPALARCSLEGKMLLATLLDSGSLKDQALADLQIAPVSVEQCNRLEALASMVGNRWGDRMLKEKLAEKRLNNFLEPSSGRPRPRF